MYATFRRVCAPFVLYRPFAHKYSRLPFSTLLIGIFTMYFFITASSYAMYNSH